MFRRSLAIAAAIAMAGLGTVGVQPAPTVVVNSPRAAKGGLFGGQWLAPIAPWGYGYPGTTMAQQKRASKKARNVKRHRAAARG